jgi:hypothetical protein
MNLRYNLRMLYLILGGLLVIALLVMILRKNSGETGHHTHDDAMWSGHSDNVNSLSQSEQSTADHGWSSDDGGSNDSGSSSSDSGSSDSGSSSSD